MHDSLSIDEIKELFFTDEEVGGKPNCVLSFIFLFDKLSQNGEVGDVNFLIVC